MPPLRAWIFDVSVAEDGMDLWLLDADGCLHKARDLWSARFFVGENVSQAGEAIHRHAPACVTTLTEKFDLFTGMSRTVLEARVPPPAYAPLTRRLTEQGNTLFDADIPLVQAYHYDRAHFPLARCVFDVGEGQVRDWALEDDPWAVDMPLPPFRTVHLSLTGSETAGRLDPNQAVRGRLCLVHEGQTHELEGDHAQQLQNLAGRLKEWDPDILFTDWGDSHLIPRLEQLSQAHHIPLPWSRDPNQGCRGRAGKTFWSYGRAVYQMGSRPFIGRWHLDCQNSFFLKECGLEGLLDIARTTQMPVQTAARSTIGTALTSLQLSRARARNILIPMDKQQLEDFRSADALVTADKGGLVYEPKVGWFDRVAEFDFVSLYPTLMVRHNISPETVNCSCCPDNPVPEIGHHLCRRRRGLVPEVLEPLLAKRAALKTHARQNPAEGETLRRRAAAFKWVLVCCFGYLGYKNARFGKIESHECVTAWGRETLLRAKDALEQAGLDLLHANVDSLYVPLGKDTDLKLLRTSLETAAQCPIALEGVYRWIRFCPSRQDPHSGVPNRYFGAFESGELKTRGVALRRRDTPLLFKNLQNDLLERLAQAQDVAACRHLAEDLWQSVVEDYRDRLRHGGATAPELAVTVHLSRSPEDYVHDTLSALAARALAASGVTLHVGETLRYVVVSAQDRVKDWRVIPLPLLEELTYDPAYYQERLERAAGEILEGLSWNPPWGIPG